MDDNIDELKDSVEEMQSEMNEINLEIMRPQRTYTSLEKKMNTKKSEMEAEEKFAEKKRAKRSFLTPRVNRLVGNVKKNLIRIVMKIRPMKAVSLITPNRNVKIQKSHLKTNQKAFLLLKRNVL